MAEHAEANTPNVPPETQAVSVASPINLVLLSFLVLIAYLRLRPRPPPTLPKGPASTVFQTFTPPTLLPFNGKDNSPVYLAVRGQVFDVTPGKNFYGPSGPYANFAGRDASRGLACGSFDEDMLTKNLEGPLDTLNDLDEEALDTLNGWEERFKEKYLIVGELKPVDSEKAEKAGL